MPKVIVIGAGVVGSAVAYGLSQRGARVTVLEAARPAIGTSRASFAWINANDKLPRPYHDLNAAGLAEYHRLRHDFGDEFFHPTGQLQVATDPEERAYLRQKVERLGAWDYGAELIDAARARELEPDLVFPPAGAAEYGYFPREGWVAGPVLVHRFLEAAVRAGAEVLYPVRVNELRGQGDRVTGVATTRGEISADVVVDCSGPAAGELLRPLGREIARQSSPGLLLISEPLPTCLGHVTHFPGVHLRPDGAGRVRFGSRQVDETLPSDGTVSLASEPVHELRRRAGAVLPALAEAEIEAVRVGWRPMPADGYSAVGGVPGVSGYYLVFTHSGFSLGPILGKLVADEIVADRPRAELETFRPARLVENRA